MILSWNALMSFSSFVPLRVTSWLMLLTFVSTTLRRSLAMSYSLITRSILKYTMAPDCTAGEDSAEALLAGAPLPVLHDVSARAAASEPAPRIREILFILC